MTNILDAILGAQGGGAAAAVGQKVGLSPEQTSAALSALVPVLAAGLTKNASLPGGLDALIGALAKGGHARYIDDPATLQDKDAVTDGNAILGHILGSKDESRKVAREAAADTGIKEEILKQLLPIAASLVMGALAKQPIGGAAAVAGVAGVPGAGILAVLTPILDRNKDGSMVDDVLGQVSKLFKR
jgi:hypothetical protein